LMRLTRLTDPPDFLEAVAWLSNDRRPVPSDCPLPRSLLQLLPCSFNSEFFAIKQLHDLPDDTNVLSFVNPVPARFFDGRSSGKFRFQ